MPIFHLVDGKWVKESKQEVMLKVDIEGKSPCDKCWKTARDCGIYVWPLKEEAKAKAKRCLGCGRIV